jgi:NodT family efflux transporter outer membrane factor (OMF) lipoprotein
MSDRRSSGRLWRAGPAFAAMLLAGCGIPRIAPQVHALGAATMGLQGAAAAPAVNWWQGFDDPQLDGLMGDALAANPTLEDVLARLRIATAEVESQKAALLPQIAIDGEDERTRISGDYTIPPPYAGSDRWLGTVQSGLTWTLDFAGRQRALINQAKKSSEAAALDADAARLILTGSVAETYVGLARAELQIRIADSFVRSREESLALARTRARNDLDSQFDIRAAETLLAQAQQSLDKAKGDRALMAHALAALAGRGADAYAGLTPPVLRFETALPLPASLPANLLDRRPDILSARARIEAASAGRAAARADFYPSVDLHAFLGVSSVALATLLTSSALTYGVGPSVHVPIFEGGRLRAQYRAATAEVDDATAAYDALAVSAVQQAADALSSVDTTEAEAVDQRKIIGGLADTVRLDQVRVRTGLSARLDVLASGDELLQARQTQADLDSQALTARIQLLIAVGGDFDPSTHVKTAAVADRSAHIARLP